MKPWIPSLASLALVLAACGGASAAREIGVSARDLPEGKYAFEPAVLTVRPGEKVTFVVKNDGKQDHEFEGAEAGIEEIVVAPGKAKRAAWQAPSKSGTYPVYCDLPGHRAGGMELTLVVQ